MKIKLIISIIFSTLICVGGFIMIHNSRFKTPAKNNNLRIITISVLGAVRFHGPFSMKFGTSLRNVLAKAELMYEADLREVKFKKQFFKDEVISIPFKEGYEKKVKLKDVVQADLLRIGIRKKTAMEIMKFIRRKKWKNVSWLDLDSLRGVGETTLSLLKKILELN